MGFFALCWDRTDPPPLPARLEGPLDGWSNALELPGAAVWVAGPRPPVTRVVARGAGVVIGDLFASSEPGTLDFQALEDAGYDPLVLAGALSRTFWGRYVALLGLGASNGPAVFRDPSGAVEALSWRASGLTVIASGLPSILLETLPPKLGVDPARVAAWLAAPAAMAGPSALVGVHALGPGMLSRPGRAEVQVWRPADWVAAGAPAEPAAYLRETVDRTVAALAAGRTGVLMEVSGGLDSSIVASALARSRKARVVQWLNYRAESGEGDELAFAGRLADFLGVPLTEGLKPEFALTAQALAAVSRGPRPGINGLDAERDRDIAARATEAGADTIMTGQGGDMAFFQAPTPLVAVDHLRTTGLRGVVDPSMLDTALWLRQSVWRLAQGALADRLGRGPGLRDPYRPASVTPVAVDGETHPWLIGLEAAPPAKRLQVASLVEKLTLYGENVRAGVADVVHPLMAQPVLELCLSIPTPVLTRGGRDRALAREAFARRLPREIVQRRTKGSLGGYYARMTAASLPFLRPFLLEGRLAGMGLLDAARLEPLLTREQLTLRGDYPSILFTAMVEAWVRAWELRIGNQRS